MTIPPSDKPVREWWIVEKESDPDQCVYPNFPGAICVVEYSALTAALKERDEALTEIEDMKDIYYDIVSLCEASGTEDVRVDLKGIIDERDAALAEVERYVKLDRNKAMAEAELNQALDKISAQAAELARCEAQNQRLHIDSKLSDLLACRDKLHAAESLLEEMAGALRDMTKVGIDDSSGNSELVWCRQHAKAALLKYEGWK